MTRRGDGLSGRGRFLVGTVLLVAIAFIIWDASVRGRHLLEVSASYGVTVDAPAVTERSPTGYENGRRSLVLPDGAADGAHWLMQTQAMSAEGEWRLRRVDYDNAPQGREVHWASPIHWWLGSIAWIDGLWSERPAGISLERAALLAGPIMLVVWLLGLAPLLARKFSLGAAALVTFGAVAVYPFYIDFIAGRPDHHGAANLCGLFTVLFLLAGWGGKNDGNGMPDTTADAERRRTRRWFSASAVAGGVGLWISAATQVPVLIGIGAGALLASWVGRKAPQRVAWMTDPGLFRRWGWVGGGVSFAAYLVEYFPANFGFRLEVNHPLYALAWMGAGEVLAVSAGGMQRGFRALTRGERSIGIAGGIAVLALPLTIAITAEKTFALTDPFIWKIHSAYISEFQGLLRHFTTKGFGGSGLAMCLPMLLLAPPLVRVFRRATPSEVKAQLLLVGVPAVLGWIMGWTQVRWLSLAFALTIPVVAVFFRMLEAEAAVKPRLLPAWALAGLLLFLPGAVNAVQRTLAAAEFTTEEIRSLAMRDVGHWLRLRAGNERVVVAGSPTATTKLIAFGGVSGLGTLYWENAAGLKKTAALFGASSSEEARELVLRLGVTHLVFFSWDAFEVALAKLHRGLPDGAPIPSDLFIANLLGAPIPPPWLRAIPFKLPEHAALAGQQIRIWEVVPEQSPASAAARAVDYQLELGAREAATRLVPALSQSRRELPAAVMLAAVASRQRDAGAFSAAMEEVFAQLGRAEALALDEHVRLVVVLTVAQRLELARAQLQACVRKVDERSLRHLTPGTLSDLLALTEALEVPLPDAPLKRLAEQLIPPARRK